MKIKHPLAIVGIAIFVLSWLFLMFGARAETFRDLVNFHKLAIGQSGIVTGIGLWIMGVLFEIRGYLLRDKKDAGTGIHNAGAAVGL